MTFFYNETARDHEFDRRKRREYRVCTCRLATVHATDIDPPELVRDADCVVHGRDPDAERERRIADEIDGYDRDDLGESPDY